MLLVASFIVRLISVFFLTDCFLFTLNLQVILGNNG